MQVNEQNRRMQVNEQNRRIQANEQTGTCELKKTKSRYSVEGSIRALGTEANHETMVRACANPTIFRFQSHHPLCFEKTQAYKRLTPAAPAMLPSIVLHAR